MAVEDYTTLLWLMIGDTPYLSADGRERIKEKVEMLKKKRMDIALEEHRRRRRAIVQ